MVNSEIALNSSWFPLSPIKSFTFRLAKIKEFTKYNVIIVYQYN